MIRMACDEALGCRDHRRQRTLHVSGTTTIQHAVPYCRRNGSDCHLPLGPAGMTSVCPAKHNTGPVSPRLARNCRRRQNASAHCGIPGSQALHHQPLAAGILGVTDVRLMRSMARSRCRTWRVSWLGIIRRISRHIARAETDMAGLAGVEHRSFDDARCREHQRNRLFVHVVAHFCRHCATSCRARVEQGLPAGFP